MKWNVFALAALLAAYLLLNLGAPPLAIALGILGGYLWHRRSARAQVINSGSK